MHEPRFIFAVFDRSPCPCVLFLQWNVSFLFQNSLTGLILFSARGIWSTDTLHSEQYCDPCELEPTYEPQWKRHIIHDICVSKRLLDVFTCVVPVRHSTATCDLYDLTMPCFSWYGPRPHLSWYKRCINVTLKSVTGTPLVIISFPDLTFKFLFPLFHVIRKFYRFLLRSKVPFCIWS